MSGRVCTEYQKKLSLKAGNPIFDQNKKKSIELPKVSVSDSVVILWFYEMWYEFCQGLYLLKGFVPDPVEAERRPQDPQSFRLHLKKNPGFANGDTAFFIPKPGNSINASLFWELRAIEYNCSFTHSD